MNLLDPQGLLDDDMLAAVSRTTGFMLERMEERNAENATLRRYYDGDPPMPWVHAKAARAYRSLMAQARSNFPLLVIDSVGDRLTVDGFRLDAQEADDMVWRDIWQRNAMDIFAPMVHREALVTGTGYVSVLTARDGSSRLRGESSDEVFHDHDADDPLVAARAVKVWADLVSESKYLRLLTRDMVLYASAPYDPRTEPEVNLTATSWVINGVAPNPTGLVPIIPVLNRPGLDGRGRSEIADLLPNFDRINTLTAQLLLAAELGAFRIRWATGIEIPTDSNGLPVEPFDIALNRLWTNSDPEGRFGSFEGTPLSPYAESIDQAIQQVAAISRTPPFLLLGKLTNLSAEALKATESGLVQKVRRRQQTIGQSWQEVVRLALRGLGDPRADMPDMEVIWRDPENVSEGARVDALTKLYAIGLPWRAVMERYGATPPEINRWESMRSDDVFARMLLEGVKTSPAPGLLVGGTTAGETP